MIYNEDKRIKLQVPFLKERTILYVDSSLGTSHVYIEEHWEDLVRRFDDVGYRFLFLPDLAVALSPDILHYMLPGQNVNLLAEDMYHEIRELANLGDKTGFLYKQNGLTYFREIPESTDEATGAAFDGFITSLNQIEARETGNTRFRIRRDKEPDILPYQAFDFDDALEAEETTKALQKPLTPSGSDIRFSIRKDEEALDPRTQSIIDEWERLAAKFGITIHDLEVILGYKVKLSRLFITTSNKIYLADLDGRPEVKLDDLTKALYFFYLKHPKGAAFKELQSYEKEILHLYMGITGRDDLGGIRKTVSALVSPYSDGRNTCVSRIKKAFRDIVGDHIAKNYYIDGHYAGVRTVGIDRDLVIWEH